MPVLASNISLHRDKPYREEHFIIYFSRWGKYLHAVRLTHFSIISCRLHVLSTEVETFRKIILFSLLSELSLENQIIFWESWLNAQSNAFRHTSENVHPAENLYSASKKFNIYSEISILTRHNNNVTQYNGQQQLRFGAEASLKKFPTGNQALKSRLIEMCNSHSSSCFAFNFVEFHIFFLRFIKCKKRVATKA